MKEYRKKASIMYSSMLVSCIALTIAIVIISLIKDNVRLAAFIGYVPLVITTIQFYMQQNYVSIDKYYLKIMSVHKNELIENFPIKDIHTVLFEPVLLSGHRISIMCGKELTTYDANLLGHKEMTTLKKDLVDMNIRVIISD